MSNRVAPKLLAEFICTFALVFIGAGAASVGGHDAGAPLEAVGTQRWSAPWRALHDFADMRPRLTVTGYATGFRVENVSG